MVEPSKKTIWLAVLLFVILEVTLGIFNRATHHCLPSQFQSGLWGGIIFGVFMFQTSILDKIRSPQATTGQPTRGLQSISLIKILWLLIKLFLICISVSFVGFILMEGISNWFSLLVFFVETPYWQQFHNALSIGSGYMIGLTIATMVRLLLWQRDELKAAPQHP